MGDLEKRVEALEKKLSLFEKKYPDGSSIRIRKLLYTLFEKLRESGSFEATVPSILKLWKSGEKSHRPDKKELLELGIKISDSEDIN